MKYYIVLLFTLACVINAQDTGSISRLLYEFPAGRPAYSPLKNEIEIAPRLNYWGNMSAGIDMEYALSSKLIAEVGISYSKEGVELPSYVQETGIEAGLYYTFLSAHSFAFTAGFESSIPIRSTGSNESDFSLEPVIICATSAGSFQFHGAAGGEFTEGSFNPNFYIAAILDQPTFRPFLQISGRQGFSGITISPGACIPFSQDLQLGVGLPFSTSKNTNTGIILFLAVELGDED